MSQVFEIAHTKNEESMQSWFFWILEQNQLNKLSEGLISSLSLLPAIHDYWWLLKKLESRPDAE